MDTIDVSEEERYIALFQQFKENAEKARRRKGEKPRDHQPPGFLIMQFLFHLRHTANEISKGNHMLYTSQVPSFYPPCARPIHELKPLMISNLRLETHHRGSYVMIRVMTPANRMTAVTAIVEDQEGTATMLQLYNQPEESKVAKEHIIQENDICIIKEPFFKVTNDGSYSLRADHVSDIIWLQSTDDRIPLNRSLANFHLDRPEKALLDAQKGNAGDDSLVEKALFREAKALYALRKFSLCREKLVLCVRYNPKNSDAWNEIKRVQQRLEEEKTGSYRFSDMYEQAKKTPPLIDCATCVGSVEVRDSPGRGKGLFTTKPVKAGELLICEKAFTYSYAGGDSNTGKSNTTVLMNWHTKSIWVGGQANLINQTVQKLFHNPDEGKAFTELDHGDYTPVAVSEADGAPVVDTFFIVRTIQLNCFGAPRTSYESSMSTPPILNNGGEMPKDKSTKHTTCGIWPIASRINHSCVANCCRTFIGDMQIVRACTDLEAGAELVFEYHVPGSNETYEETQKKLSHWGFVCECARCLNMKSTPRKALKERKALAAKLMLAMKQSPSPGRLNQATALLKEIEKTYINNPATPPVLRAELSDTYFTLGAYLAERNNLMEGLELLLKGLEASGYVVEACPPRNMEEGKTKTKTKKIAVLNIKRWGRANEFIVWAFSKMVDAYNKLAPDISDVAKGYFRVAYSISCGEDETIQTLFPGFTYM